MHVLGGQGGVNEAQGIRLVYQANFYFGEVDGVPLS